VRATVRRVGANLPDELGGGQVRWGTELELRVIGEGLERSRTAGYLAKYTTKSTEQAGGLLHRVAEDEVDRLAVSDHVRRYLRNAFELHHRVGPERRLAACAHAFGHRGHCLTKSRRYSTTFTALRKARERHVREQLLGRCGDDAQRALVESERIASFRYVGQGHLTTADAFLAASAAARAREQRRAAGEALATAAIDQQTTEGRTDGDRLCSRDKSAAGRPRDRAAMTSDEVAAALGVNRKFVYARAATGALRGYKLGPHYRFRPEDVRAFLEASIVPRDTPPAPRARPQRSAPVGSFRALVDRTAA
jgi:excisionase family DNA binding protein